jgi:hypothetical protein
MTKDLLLMEQQTNDLDTEVITTAIHRGFGNDSDKSGNTNCGTMSCLDHAHAHRYFKEDAATTMRNECNRTSKQLKWKVSLCEGCTKTLRKDCFHVTCQRRGYLCL